MKKVRCKFCDKMIDRLIHIAECERKVEMCVSRNKCIYNHGDYEIVEVGEEFYECPYCSEIIAEDEEEAKEFLLRGK